MRRRCSECSGEMPIGLRRDARFCSGACRVRAHRRRTAETFPVEMRERDRWMRYRLVPRGDKVTKVPTQVDGRQASSTASRTWSSFVEAKASEVGAGMGFALGDGIGCIDLDGAIEAGRVKGWAQEVLDLVPGTFVEVSQSGRGLHIFGLLPEGPGRNRRLSGEEGIEFYSAGRFIAVTGRRHGDAPSRLADLSGLVPLLV